MTPADRRFVLEAILRAFNRLPAESNQVGCIYALRECEESLGAIPSSRKYVTWRAAQDDQTGLPTKAEIEGAFGSWNAAKAALGEASHDPEIGWTGFGASGFKIEDEEYIQGIRLWFEEIGLKTHPRYGLTFVLPTALETRTARTLRAPSADAYCTWIFTGYDGDARFGASHSGFCERFGSWSNTLRIANEGGAHSAEVQELIRIALLDRRERLALIKPFVTRASKELGANFNGRQYDAWARDLASRSVSLEERVLLGAMTSFRIARYFPSWKHARAVLLGAAHPTAPVHKPRNAQAMLALVAEWASEQEGPLLRRDYIAWREARRAIGLGSPSPVTLRRRFGSWEAALALALIGESK